MSLIAYHPREGREIVLRHRNAIVVRDPTSQRLELRGITECPTCHQSLRPTSPDRHGFDQQPTSSMQDTFVDPGYFRMLRAGQGDTTATIPPPSPIRRLIRPVLVHEQPASVEEVEDAEFVSSTPSVQQGSRIRKEAFSPNYFKTFFVEERELGRGGKGVVLLVRHEIDGCHLGHFACKRVPVGDDHAWLEKVLIEVELLAQLSHPNLVSYRHVWLENVQLTRFGPKVASAFILQQYCNGGDLLNYIIGDQPRQTTNEELKARMRRRSKGQAERPPGDPLASQRHLSFEEIYSLFKDITSGLDYLHAANYIHRDLKPSNCLLHHEGGILICLISDFGEVQPENSVRKSTGSTGTISYCAPEVLRQDPSGNYGNFTTKSDIFSLGIILYFLCFGRLPYRSANHVNEDLEDIDELRAEITDWQGFQDERRERPDLPSKLYQLLKRLLAIDPAQRPSTKEVLAAMKNDSNLDGIPGSANGRSASPSSIGIQGRRVQNLDSPVVPGSPVPDPQKHQRYDRPGRASTDVVASSSADLANDPAASLANVNLRRNSDITALRHYARPVVSSPTRDRFSSHSPERNTPDQRSVSPRRPLADAAPPLLMAPPRTWTADLLWRFTLAWYYLARLFAEGAPLPHLFRIAGFLAKVLTLSRPCWPYMINPWVGGLLVALAALDLGAGDTHRRRPSHVVVARWQDQGQQSALAAPDARASVLLAAAHFAVLWAAERGVVPLCAPSLDPWRPDEAG
ncbi:calcium-dependent protein kinase [Plectosphaerella plurivora]|uniref:non-specific serine/threonine protein kinase n=1 Tax=Plectosphaerella plurivora TaxID=936078 RepID=A0A9P8V1R9_9PEZI|nr:calcium-dependent protein kinase [Plectosphaerella plurivora]